MIRILKGELKYHYKFVLIFTIIMNIWLVIAFFKSGGDSDPLKDVVGVMTLAEVVLALCAISLFVDRFRTGRDRLLVLLPVSVRDVGIARFMIVPVFWIMIAALYCLTLMTVMHITSLSSIFLTFMVMSGVVLFFYSLYLISYDLCAVLVRKYRVFGIYNDQIPGVLLGIFNAVLLVYFVVFSVPYFGLNSPHRDYLVRALFTYTGASIFVLVGICLSIMSIVLFEKRRTYRE
ncbi:hypothetical protein LLG96_05655 [bacterium]|nr:hypothetical protein [bacterium]